MIRIYGARDPIEAEFVKGLFEAEGIAAVVQGNALQAVIGEVPPTPASLPSVWVNEADADRSRQIVDEMRRGGPAALDPRPAWTCAACGTEVEGQFTQCWNCGTARADAGPVG